MLFRGRLAQLVRAPALQAGGPRFEPATAHGLRTALIVSIVALAIGPAVVGAQSPPYPATASFVASDAPDVWNAAGGGSFVAIALNGTVDFNAATVEPHDASFGTANSVACLTGATPTGTRVPAEPSASWNGSCTFSEPGYFAFVCTVHPTTMTGEVAVAGADGTLAPRAPVTPGGPAVPGAPGVPGLPGEPSAPGGPAASALRPVFDIDREQRGTVVRGTISGAGPAATATIDVTANRRDLTTAKRKPAGTVRLRRLTRTTSAAGATTFAITLSANARRALPRNKRLAITLRATVRGSSVVNGVVTRTQRVTLLAPGVAFTAAASGPVEVRDDFFTPRNVRIRRGGRITWTWRGARPHNVVGDNFRGPTQSAGTFTRTFAKAGSYRYACSLHTGMSGVIAVR